MKFVKLWFLTMLVLAIAGCGGGGGGGGGNPSPLAGQWIADLDSTDLDGGIAANRKFDISNLTISKSNQITGGKILHVPSGQSIEGPGLITGKVTLNPAGYVTYVEFRTSDQTALPGNTGITYLEGNTDDPGDISPSPQGGQGDPQKGFNCDLSIAEHGSKNDPNYAPAGFRATHYQLNVKHN